MAVKIKQRGGKWYYVVAFALVVAALSAHAAEPPSYDHQPAAGYGEDLFRLVRAYSDLGFHRTGTKVDAQTVEWFAHELERRGGKVQRQTWKFDRFDGTSTVTIDGRQVESMPLYYEGVGDVRTDTPFVASVNVLAGGDSSRALLDAIAQGKASGAKAAVIATENPLGLLQIPNREPKLASGLPVVLVPGSAAEALRRGKVQVRYSAKIVPGQSTNVLVAFGSPAASSTKPIVIATPLSGWFECAAERGTGIAIALVLARRLAANHRVIVVGSPGHEQVYIGLAAFLARNKLDPALVIHLGANVALGMRDGESGQVRLAPGADRPSPKQIAIRSLFVRMEPATFEAREPALTSAGLRPVLNPPQWNGEGEQWSHAVNAPLLSFVGTGPQFHTPADLPEAVTGPALLATVYDALASAIDTFVARGH